MLQDRGSKAVPEVVGRFPCSTMQRQMWFLDQMEPGDPSLNVAMRWEIAGRIQDASIDRAFQAIVDRHEILRTRFVVEDGEPEQEVLDRAEFRPTHIDLRTTPEAERPARVAEIAEEEAARPLSLDAPCAMRAVAVRVAADHVTLLITVHHAIFDGYSIKVMAAEFGALAEAFEAGRAPALPELPLQYGDFTLWQREYLASGALAEDRAYWAEQMRGVGRFEIEPDKPRAPRRSLAIARLHRDLEADFGDRLTAAGAALGASGFSFGAALIGASLSRVTGAAEVVLSTPVADRAEPDLEALIGPFIVNQILRLPTEAGAAFASHVGRVQSVVEGALAHRNLPFSALVEIVNPPRDPSRAPIASVALSLMQVFMPARQYEGFHLTSSPAFNPGSAQDMHILILGRESGWRLTIEYCPDLYEQTTIQALLDTIAGGFERVFASTALRLDDLPLAPALAARGDGTARGLKRIEEALLRHPAVDAAAAVPSTAGAYAFVSPPPDSLTPLETLPAALAEHLAAALPAAERPSGISVLAALPRLASGDIDRARLPEPPARAAEPAKALARPSLPPSQDDIEARLAELWRELLDRTDIPRDRSFFDLGGHSLLAVRLVARIRASFGVNLGVANAYATPTLPGLARLIAAELAPTAAAAGPAPATEAEEDWRIEPLQTGGEGLPIVAVNDVAIVVSALGHMKTRHPATCVRLFDGTRGIDQIERSFEEIAAEYAKVVRKLQPKGPYVLFGVCVHGNIALETARVLQSEGEEIRAVILKDVWEPGYVERLKGDSFRRWLERLAALRTKLRFVREGSLSISALLGSYRIVRKTGVLQFAKKLGLIDRVRWTDLTPEQERFVAYISRARNVYRPLPFSAPVLHVITRITPRGRAFAPSIGWEEVVTGRLKTVYIDDIRVQGGKEFGTPALAAEIERFLAEQAP